MNRLNELLQELGISKVRLAKYLGVSRQMVYNYLELKNLNKWPKEKKLLLFKLLDIENGEESSLSKIKVNTEYLMSVEQRLNQGVKDSSSFDTIVDLKGLNKDEQQLLSDIIFLIKDRFSESISDPKLRKSTYHSFLYLYHMLQSMNSLPEIKYLLAYFSKVSGITSPRDFKFNEDKQLLLEGIVHSALNLYHNGGASRSKVLDSHNRFVQEMEIKKEEKLSRTQKLDTIRIKALRELNYDEITMENATEVYEKMDEIENRNQ